MLLGLFIDAAEFTYDIVVGDTFKTYSEGDRSKKPDTSMFEYLYPDMSWPKDRVASLGGLEHWEEFKQASKKYKGKYFVQEYHTNDGHFQIWFDYKGKQYSWVMPLGWRPGFDCNGLD